MAKAVRFSSYGGPEVLEIVDVPRPVPGAGQVLVRMKAAGINPGESKIRQGLLHTRFPAAFPSGEGSDLAGIVEEVAAHVEGVAVGDEVVGFTDQRASHAELVLVEAADLTPRPAGVPWEVAGSLFVVGTTAYATVRAVTAGAGDTIVVAGAAGGVGATACQLAQLKGAQVIGIAGDADHAWLEALGVKPLGYDGDVTARLRLEAPHIDGFIDTVGHGYVKMAIDLGVAPDRIDTIADFPAVEQFGVKGDGNAAAANAPVLAELLDLISQGKLDIPIARTFPLAEVRNAYQFLEEKHGRGKVVLTD
jgi:NADPH:quinone reductase-like Zn-dependent oxidoreductase